MTPETARLRWFTVAVGSDRAAINAVYRGALTAQRRRIADFSVDVLSDSPWPSDVLWAVAELESRLAARHERARPWFLRWLPGDRAPTVDLRLEDDHDFALAMAVAPYSIGGTGISDLQTMIWDGNDTGTSGAFQLTEAEVAEVTEYMAAAGVDVSHLVPLLRRGNESA